MVQNENKILLHACCGICSAYPITLLKNMGYTPIVYFCNPNLDTQEEFNRRLEAQKRVCTEYNAELVVENYNHQQYIDFVKGLENEPERGLRCDKCIELRLTEAAKKAVELQIPNFTTSLVISPHKNFVKISDLGEKIAMDYNLRYVKENFKKKDGFLKSNKMSKELNLYRQNYCGCEYAK